MPLGSVSIWLRFCFFTALFNPVMWCSLNSCPVGFYMVSSVTNMLNSLYSMCQMPKGQAHRQLQIASPARIPMKYYPWYVEVFHSIYTSLVVWTVIIALPVRFFCCCWCSNTGLMFHLLPWNPPVFSCHCRSALILSMV